ncbi:MAG: nucleotidyltransferase, partial [Oscillospiraceae bacterium]|nr:nucleotidyltransferase [Oscillospiraceae bacterium]
MKPTLVVMAAGMASRYGSLKQIEPVGRNGEIILEYAVYDAVQAGFGRVVFIVKEDFIDEFKQRTGRAIARRVPVDYVCQRQGDFVDVQVPGSRVKPWGTGHAVLCVKGMVNEPFCVVNADDFYGAAAFEAVSRFLQSAGGQKPYECCMAGFRAGNTMSEYGTVSRGVCGIDKDGRLERVTEYLKLMSAGGVITDRDTGAVIADDALV